RIEQHPPDATRSGEVHDVGPLASSVTALAVPGAALLSVRSRSEPTPPSRGRREIREPDEAVRAAQQESLLRVAELVADGAASSAVFATIAREIGRVIAMPMVAVWRFDPGETATVIGEWSDRPHPFRVGTSWPVGGPPITARVRASGRPERIDDFSRL